MVQVCAEPVAARSVQNRTPQWRMRMHDRGVIPSAVTPTKKLQRMARHTADGVRATGYDQGRHDGDESYQHSHGTNLGWS
jgi:hypothetical protein